MVFTLLVALAELASAETRDPRLSDAMRQLQREQARPTMRVDQLHNPRTGVTCTMRILQARPVDPDAVAPAPDATVDPDIRGKRVSPCVD